MGLSFCISKVVPGDADADDLETTLSKEMLLSSKGGEEQTGDIFLQL